MSKIVRLDIVDNDADYSKRLQGTYYLKNPDEAKLRELKIMITNRFDEENPFVDSYIAVEEYIEDNFETVEIETKEIEW